MSIPAPDDRPPPPIVNAPWPVLALIAVMAVVHLALYWAGDWWFARAYAGFAMIPAVVSGDVAPWVEGSQYWGFLTHAFLHSGFLHLLFNGLWLLIFGTVVARRMGPWRFLLVFLASAVGGAVLMLVLHWGEIVYLIGASGGVSGLLAASIPVMYAGGQRRGFAAVAAPVEALKFRALLSNRNALAFMAIWLALTMLSGSTGLLIPGEPQNIAWEAHIGGFIAGLAAFYCLDRSPSPIV
jgi:membrane associated rhomboid family serine protease